MNIDRRQNEMKILSPLLAGLYNEDVVIDESKVLHEVEALHPKDFYSLFNRNAFTRFGSPALQAVLQEAHGKFCDRHDIMPGRVICMNVTTVEEYVKGEYNPFAKEIIFNEIFLGHMFDEGMHVELSALRAMLELSAERLQYENFVNEYKNRPVSDFDRLISTNAVAKCATKAFDRSIGQYREYNGINLQRYDVHQTAIEDMVDLYQKGFLPDTKEVRRFLKDAINEYKDIPDDYIYTEAIRDSEMAKIKLEHTFDGPITENLLDLYRRVDVREVYKTIKERNRDLRLFAQSLQEREYDEGR